MKKPLPPENGLQIGSVKHGKPINLKIGNRFQSCAVLCRNALNAVENARQKCLQAGHALLELKVDANGDFMSLVSQYIPEVSHRTVNLWMRAAENVARALPPCPFIDVEAEVSSISGVLTSPEDQLSDEARDWKQLWLDFTEDKTIKECIAGVMIDGDEECRIDRAVNGKTRGGAGGDRKDYPLHAAMKLRQMGTHLGHWEGMTEVQKSEVKQVLYAAITGDECKLTGRQVETIQFEPWPAEVCALVADALKERVRGNRK